MAKKSKFLPDNLKLIRQILEITQTEMGKILGATKTMVQSYESGKAEPRGLYMEKVAHLTEVDVYTLTNTHLQASDIKREGDVLTALKTHSNFKFFKNDEIETEFLASSKTTIPEEVAEKALQGTQHINRHLFTHLLLLTGLSYDELIDIDFFSLVNAVRRRDLLINKPEEQIKVSTPLYSDIDSDEEQAIYEIVRQYIRCFTLDAELFEDLSQGVKDKEALARRHDASPIMLSYLYNSAWDFAVMLEKGSLLSYSKMIGDVFVLKSVNHLDPEWKPAFARNYLAVCQAGCLLVSMESPGAEAELTYLMAVPGPERVNERKLDKADIISLFEVVCMILH